eukprot:495170_1
MPEVIQVGLNDDYSVNINGFDMDGNTALMISCKYDSPSVATELLRNHCSLDILNKIRQNALIMCSIYGASQIAAMLTTLGSEIDHQDKYGKTALMYAATKGYTGIVANLIKYGADENKKDLKNMDAIEHANKAGKFEIVKMIKNGTLQDVTDILQQMEIMKQKNKALEKAVTSLQGLNSDLTDEINRTELQKNQIQKKLADTMNKMKTQFSSRRQMSPISNNSASSVSPKVFPKMNINLKDKMGGVSNKFGTLFSSNNASNTTNKNTGNTPKAPTKDIQL